MGYDLDLFDNPDAISSQLTCTICSGVLKNPVQTPCEHLFWYDPEHDWRCNASFTQVEWLSGCDADVWLSRPFCVC